MIALVLTLMFAQGIPPTADFVVAEASTRPAALGRGAPNKFQVTVPVVVTVEGGGSLPAAAAAGGIPTVKLVPVAGGPNLESSLLDSRGIAIPVTGVTEEYRVSVENLPPGYTVKSLTFGSTNLATDTLKASLGELGVLGPRIVTYTGEGELQRLIDEILRRRAGPKTLSVTLEKN